MIRFVIGSRGLCTACGAWTQGRAGLKTVSGRTTWRVFSSEARTKVRAIPVEAAPRTGLSGIKVSD